MPNIIVTGANGRLGSAVVKQLMRLFPASLRAVSVRYPKAARSWSDAGIDVRHGDFDLPGTLPRAFAGADRLLIISTSTDNASRIEQHRHAITAAREAGVGHIYYTSIIQREGSLFLPAEGHLQTEADLRHSGEPSTILRNGQYMENLAMFVGLGIDSDTLALPADGPTAWVALDDLAEGIARILASPDRCASGNRTVTLTGPEAVDFERIAALTSKLLGRRLERKVVSDEDFERHVVANGLGSAMGKVLASGFRSRAAGELTEVDPTLSQILGRPLRTVESELPRILQQVEAKSGGRPAQLNDTEAVSR